MSIEWSSFPLKLIASLSPWDIFLRGACLLFLLDWIFYLPIFRSLFAEEKGCEWKARPSKWVILAAAGWLLSIGIAGFGPEPLQCIGWAALWVIFRLVFIKRRWSSVRRGCGAPGFMSHWTALWVFAVCLARLIDGTGWLVGQIFFTMRLDFAIIMLCAGSYKIAVGYLRGNGMEFGRVNPIWGYHWKYFSKKNSGGFYPSLMNVLAASTEILSGILLLVPDPRSQITGAILVSLSFLYVSFSIRLGRLAWLMALLPAVFLPGVLEGAKRDSAILGQLPHEWLVVLAIPLWSYMALLPIIKTTQYFNLFANRSLPSLVQSVITKIADAVPVIMWRVFTPDVTNFFVRIYKSENGERKLLVGETNIYEYRNWKDFWIKMRFLHVVESIALVSVFNTLKYFPSKPELFEERLIRYAKSIAASFKSPIQKMEFEYVIVKKMAGHFSFLPVMNIDIDLYQNQVSSKIINSEFDPYKPALFSPVRECVSAGSYEKKKN